MPHEDTSGANMWGLGDYRRFAKETVWDLGPILVRACEIAAGQRVLDVATGSGNVALRAAQVGASVVATDITPENLDAGRDEARSLGLALEWIQADAQDLPFEDGEFDVVTSSFGAMFAPDHHAAARELLRVCRPGGTIGLLTFTAEGLAGRFFGLVAPYLPPPPEGAQPPLLWGDEGHVRELLGDGVTTLSLTRHTYVESAPTPEAWVELYTTTFGPIVAIQQSRGESPERVEEFDRELLRFARDASRSAETAEYEFEYLLVVGRKASA
jgi:ubiquinone/menaquinone biosynthesis C-methylase UbiE